MSFSGSSQATAGVTFHITVSSQSVVAGTPIDVTVTVVASNALAAVHYGGTVTFSSSDLHASLPGDYTFQPSDNGTHTFLAGVTFTTAGSQTVTATEQGDSATTGTSPAVDVSPAPVDHFVFGSPKPSPVVAGAPTTVSVSAFDQYGNQTTRGLGTGSLTAIGVDGSSVGCDPNETGACNATSGLSSFDDSGVATVSFTAYKAEDGELTVTAGNGASTSDPFTVAAAPVDHFVYGAVPPTVVAGVPTTVSVSAFDPYDNPSSNGLDTATPSTSMNPGCGGSCPATVSLSTFDASGVGAVTFTGFKAQTGRTVTVTAQDGHGTATLTTFDVLPAPVDHFVFGAPSPTPVVAGVQSTMSVSAFDPYDNPTTSGLSPEALTANNLDGSSVGCGTQNADPCTASASLGSFDNNGVATATFTAYQAEGGRTLTVTAGNTVSGTSDPFTVTPAPVDHFVYGALSPSPVVAGVQSTMSVSAFDQYDNPSTNELNSVSLSTTMDPSSAGCSGPCTPSVAVSAPFDANGVGAVTLTGYDAETGRTVTVTAADGKKTDSPAFDVFSGPPATVTFTRQPTQAEAQPGLTCADGNNCIISYPQGVQVQAKDAFGNLANHDATVSLAIDANHDPGGGTLSNGNAGTTLPTDSNGLATFTSLTIDNVGIGYELLATGSPAAAGSTPTALSNAFIIAQKVATCSNSCSPSTVTPTTTLNVNASGTGNTALGIALVQGAQQPAGVCGSFQKAVGSPESFVNLTSTAGVGNLVLTITWTLPKSIVNAQPDNGAAHYNICLGAVNLTDPTNTPAIPGFPIKAPAACPTEGGQILSTACPVPDATFGVTFFWGVLPDCKNGKNIVGPCVQSRTKDPAGDLIFKFAVEYPWDPNGSLG